MRKNLLSKLEKDIFIMFSEGYKMTEIKTELDIGEQKLTKTFDDVILKLGAKNKIHAMSLLIKKRLI